MDRSVIASLSTGVRATLVLFLLFMLLFSFTRCAYVEDKHARKLSLEFEKERTILEQQILIIQKNIKVDLNRIKSNYQESNDDNRRKLHYADLKLTNNQIRVTQAFYALKSATEQNWKTVSQSVRQTINEIRSEYSSVAFELTTSSGSSHH